MKTGVAFAAALILAIAAAVGVKALLDTRTADIQDKENLVAILVAAQNLRAGDTLHEKSYEVDKLPGRFTKVGFVTAGQRSLVEGRTLIRGVSAREPLMMEDFTEPASQIQFASHVNTNYRAITIPVDQVTGVAGLIKPKDRVDVLATLVGHAASPTGGTSVMETLTVLENITVLAIDSRTAEHVSIPARYRRDGRGGYASVTLSVTTAEARILTLAQALSQGMLTLTLRNPADRSSDIGRTSADNLPQAIADAARERAEGTGNTNPEP